MNFVSFYFFVFFIATLFAFYLLPKRFRIGLLLVASYVFYATWSIPFIGVILITTSLDYWMTRVIHHAASGRTKKLALVSGIVLNLLILGFFKYCNFFLESSHGLAHWFGLRPDWPHAISIILPLGISFYTFEAISYLVDVYRGSPPAANWLEYNFYIMYFPHLISGPIVRFAELMPQYKNGLSLPSAERLQRGIELLVLGIAFKILIADSVSDMANALFRNPAQASILTTYLGTLAFAVQIYFDFMGYTHIARGVSLFFNIEMPLNFRHPYSATSISDFWTRWHVSLSRWIRDYLYIPLGGSRRGEGRTMLNLVLTMGLAGLWHGAAWTFVLWGLYHGILLALYHAIKRTLHRVFGTFQTHWLYQGVACLTTFVVVLLGWVLFRAQSLKDAGHIWARLLHFHGLGRDIGHALQMRQYDWLLWLTVLLACCFGGNVLIHAISRVYRALPLWFQINAICFLLLLCWIVSANTTKPFIYFQF